MEGVRACFAVSVAVVIPAVEVAGLPQLSSANKKEPIGGCFSGFRSILCWQFSLLVFLNA